MMTLIYNLNQIIGSWTKNCYCSLHLLYLMDIATSSSCFFALFDHVCSFQYARIVREALCELELPYILQNVGEGSSRSKFLVNAVGSKEVSY